MLRERFTYRPGARYYQPQISRWLSVDPLAEKYPGWSPYNYTADNPVMWVDPTGMKVDSTFTLKPNGEIVPLDDKKYYDENGREMDKIVAEETGESMLIETGVLQTRKKIKAKYRDSDGEVKEGKVQVVETTETDKGTDLFLFMSLNTNVEFNFRFYKGGNTFVATTFRENEVLIPSAYYEKLSNKAELLIDIHNHDTTPYPSDRDWETEYKVNKTNPNAIFYIFYEPGRKLIYYYENAIIIKANKK